MNRFSTANQPHPVFEYLEISGSLAEFSVVSGKGFHVNCHKVVLASLGQFLLSLFGSSGEEDQIILPDYSTNVVCRLMNLAYTGM